MEGDRQGDLAACVATSGFKVTAADLEAFVGGLARQSRNGMGRRWR
jgi:hypothetical protein